MDVIDKDGMQQLHITEVKEGGLASAKGTKCELYTASIQKITFTITSAFTF